MIRGLTVPEKTRDKVDPTNVCIQDMTDALVRVHEFSLKAELHNESSILKNVKPLVDDLIELAKMFKNRCDIERR